ncbi:MAG: hypothetical protein H0V51_10560 [Chloroflexi bacterium]|nr:hypothetical protein [Chloroflexota bacterium]
MVRINREEVVTPSGDDLLRDVALCQQGVSRDDPLGDRHLLQQRLRSGDLMPLASRTHLA